MRSAIRSQPKAKGPEVRRALIYRLGSLGDTIVALPCFHLIARTFPNAQRLMLTNFPIHAKAPSSAAVLGDSGLIHGYMRYFSGTRNPVELLRVSSEIRRFRPDVLIYLMPVRPMRNVRRDRLFFRFSGVREILGLPDEDGLTHRFDPSCGLYEREALRLARTLVALGEAGPESMANWSLCLTQAERECARSSLGPLVESPLIVCGPGTKMQAKDWGQENWRVLIAQLHKTYPEYSLALVGAKQEASIADFASHDWRGPKINLCGKLTPRESAAVLEHAAVFLGPDSGPMHLAASVGVPCVIAFSAAGIPGIWYPWGDRHQIIYHRTSCHGCRLVTCIEEARRCLTSISVEEMATAVARILGQPTRESTSAFAEDERVNPARKGEHS